MLHDFMRVLPDHLTGFQLRAHPAGYQLIVLLQQHGPLLQPLAGPKQQEEILQAPCAELTL
jgi:hypothetical protein